MALPAPGRDPWSLLGLLLSQLFLAVPLPLTAGGGGQEPLPRITYRAGEGRRALSLFHQKGLQDFDTLLLSDDGGTLYVGAREAILALDIQDPGMPKLKNMIPWPASDRKKSECAFKKKSNETQCFNFIRVLVSFNATHLYTCGTFAFSPACTFIELRDSYLLPISEDKVVEGKGQSPFDPAHKHTAVLTDGMLYSGTMNNFLGSEPILIRTLGPQPVLKTDNFLRWLQRKDPSPQPRSGPVLSAETRPESRGSRTPRSSAPAVLERRGRGQAAAEEVDHLPEGPAAVLPAGAAALQHHPPRCPAARRRRRRAPRLRDLQLSVADRWDQELCCLCLLSQGHQACL
ncbi:unnamed protein product [Gulo gulo]|uniref:Sema domain-containing protein n=1 Tax=Gulo gulo TaxID=48420 RepID=A0A9X9QBC6_GULGU|nr:unnamed protein product [Gulo gulo]